MALKFLFNEGLKNIFRNKSSFFLSVGVSTACLLLLSLFIMLTTNLLRAKNQIEEKFEIYAFLTNDADANDLMEKISTINGVRQVTYVSKDEALTELKTDLAENAGILDILERNPLPASIRIKIEPHYQLSTRLDELEQKIQILKGIKETWSGQDLLIRIEKIIRTVIGFDIGILVIVFFAIIFIVSRTVEATIVSKAREIEIMKLVGASNTMVRFPFYVEGFLHGLFGGIIAIICTVIIYLFAASQFPLLYFPWLMLVLINLVFGGLLGVAGSYLALTRILK
jgi:cell division transport system permease protein